MRNNKKAILIIAMILTEIMAMVSCTHNSNTQVVSAVSFRKDIIPIFTASCALNSSCHLGANSLNLETNFDSSDAYNTIISKNLVSTSDPSSSLLYVEVSGNGIAEMPKPPAAALSAGQQALILQWIKQGALNN